MSTESRLAQLTLKDDGFVFDPTSGDTYVANPTAVAVLRALQEGCDESQLVDVVVERFDVAESEARRDVGDLLVRLRGWQLL
jgi:PqqD family protein of HPr-rel-A system